MVVTSALHAEGREFESRSEHDGEEFDVLPRRKFKKQPVSKNQKEVCFFFVCGWKKRVLDLTPGLG